MSRTGVLHQARRSRAGRAHRWHPATDGALPDLRAASAVSGIVFAGLFLVALVLVRQAPGLAASDRVYTDFYTVGSGNVLVTVGMHIVPFAGIACLWHIELDADAHRVAARTRDRAPALAPARVRRASSSACSSRVRRPSVPSRC